MIIQNGKRSQNKLTIIKKTRIPCPYHKNKLKGIGASYTSTKKLYNRKDKVIHAGELKNNHEQVIIQTSYELMAYH